MFTSHRDRLKVVNDLGAAAGSVLRGTALGNRGLRLRVAEAQEKGHGGP